VHINDQGFTARRGEILLDAALISGIDMPHDCRSGVCGTCKIRVLSGMLIGGECEEKGVVKACQARVITDLELMVEPVPEVLTTKGTVLSITPLAPDVVEVRIRPSQAISYLPGQYYKFQFRGFPARYFSPTAPMDRPFDGSALRLHVRRIPGGRVSPAFGREIQPGHPVTLIGPHGSAYFRPDLDNRLVLIGTGTGFAPIWSIAEAAIAENPNRHMVVIAGAKTLSSLYMAPAFRRLKDYRNVQLIPTVSDKPPNVARIVRKGRPTDFIPELAQDDILYACGAPEMVDAVKSFAVASGATFYADPFTPQHGADEDEGIVARAMEWLASIAPVPGWSGQQYKALPKPEPRQAPGQQNYAPPPARLGRGPVQQQASGIRQNRGAPPMGEMQRRGPRSPGPYEGVRAE
jgi:NAD(P)H-flavin reductase